MVYNRIEEYKNAYSSLQEDSDLWAEVGHLGDLLKQNHPFYEALPKGAGPAPLLRGIFFPRILLKLSQQLKTIPDVAVVCEASGGYEWEPSGMTPA